MCHTQEACKNIKKIIVYLILLYQRYAPQDLCNSCRLDPSCSNYMIMAINKYGIIKPFRAGLFIWLLIPESCIYTLCLYTSYTCNTDYHRRGVLR
ncbi:MAG: membrane protein insertion efficiency factor YidD [Treponema sp.]|nr:membrane protein insertion efficiency factor YidD [Treponema sp.]